MAGFQGLRHQLDQFKFSLLNLNFWHVKASEWIFSRQVLDNQRLLLSLYGPFNANVLDIAYVYLINLKVKKFSEGTSKLLRFKLLSKLSMLILVVVLVGHSPPIIQNLP